MQVITTHLNADFDSLASMVAARKLYPEASLVLSGSAERAVHEYLKSHSHICELTKLKSIDVEFVDRLIIVDTQEPDRIGVFKALIGKPGKEVHVYDHHLESSREIRFDKEVIRKRGAATTILMEMLEQENIALSAEESTLMTLGIYQDTHGLLSPSTTPEDFLAVSRLVAMGADLNQVADTIQPQLNQDQINVMNDMIRNLENLHVNGVEVALATATVDYYVEDLAHVVSKLMSLENLGALFALIRLGSTVVLICRSRTGEVSAVEVARSFGGGGHVHAASAQIQAQTLVQARESLLKILNEKVAPLCLVKDVMHFPVISANPKDSLQSVENTLTRFNLNSLPIVEKNKPVGIITRQIVEKAIHHQMGSDKTEEFMIREFSVTTPESYFNTIIPMVIEEKQKLIPVVEPGNGELLAVVSRGDLLREFQRDRLRQGGEEAVLHAGFLGKNKFIKSLMKDRLDKKLLHLLETIAGIGDRTGVSVYVVGGFARDLLLGIDNQDVDLVVEGDGIDFAQTLAETLSARVKSHVKFGTSVVILPDESRLDVATARLEYYTHPAALPTVEKSSIKADLYRRDFSINTLAIRLNGKNRFCLIDYFNGERDLKEGVLRVLHNLSFIEDPSRLFRAIRFEQRFSFRMGKQTEAFMKNAIKRRLVDQLSPSRLLNELVNIFKEKEALKCIRRMSDLNLLQFISSGFAEGQENFEALERVDQVLAWAKILPLPKEPEVWFVYFLGLLCPLSEENFKQALIRLHPSQRLRNRLQLDREAVLGCHRALQSAKDFSPMEIFDIFSQCTPEAVVYLLSVADNERVNKFATLFFTQYNQQAQLELDGNDLNSLGVQPGPLFQEMFRSLRVARLNGQVHSKEDELDWVKREFL
jgi:tRNA nucleotidyltransferase (CCA-adding enzyme)